jgi:hypothetical protein
MANLSPPALIGVVAALFCTVLAAVNVLGNVFA